MRLLIVTGKHGSYHCVIESDKELHEICCLILAERLNEGWYGDDGDLATFYDAQGDINKQRELVNLLQGPMRKMCEQQLEAMSVQEQNLINEVNFRNNVRHALAMDYNENARRSIKFFAYGLLDSRAEYEYERIELTDAMTAEEFKNHKRIAI